MGILSWLSGKRTPNIRDIILDRTILAGNLEASKDKKDEIRGRKKMKKIKEILDLNKENKGKLDWAKEIRELDNI